MKKCTVCKQVKEASEFNSRERSHDGLQTSCKACNRSSSKRYYSQNREKHIKVVKSNKYRYTVENRQRIDAYLQSHPCVDCGETDIRVLEFDHVRGIKSGNVSEMAMQGYKWSRIEIEIQKCEVRCANDHRRRYAPVA